MDWGEREKNRTGSGFEKHHTCPLDPHKLVREVGLDLGDAVKLVERGRDVLYAALAGHRHREERLPQALVC